MDKPSRKGVLRPLLSTSILVEEHKALIHDMEQVSLKLVDHAFMRLAQLVAAFLVVLVVAFLLVMVLLKRSPKTHHA